MCVNNFVLIFQSNNNGIISFRLIADTYKLYYKLQNTIIDNNNVI